MHQRSLSAPRGIAPLSRSRRPDLRGPLPLLQVFARRAARVRGLGANLRQATRAGTASRPTLTTPHEAPSQWTEQGEYRKAFTTCQAQFTKDDFILWCITERLAALNEFGDPHVMRRKKSAAQDVRSRNSAAQ